MTICHTTWQMVWLFVLMLFLSHSQQCQCFDGNSECWAQPIKTCTGPILSSSSTSFVREGKMCFLCRLFVAGIAEIQPFNTCTNYPKLNMCTCPLIVVYLIRKVSFWCVNCQPGVPYIPFWRRRFPVYLTSYVSVIFLVCCGTFLFFLSHCSEQEL